MDTSNTRLRKSKAGEMLEISEQHEALLRQPQCEGNQGSAVDLSAQHSNKNYHEALGASIMRVFMTTLGCSYANLLLPFVFLGMMSGSRGWDDSLTFIFNFLAILPLAALLSFATEELAKSVGHTLGGLINATFGNAVEMIVSVRTSDLCGESNDHCAGGDYGCSTGRN